MGAADGPRVSPRGSPRVPPALAVPQTEFCNPVFEGEEPRAAPSAEQPPDKDGTEPEPRRDGLGTNLGGCAPHPARGAAGAGCRALGLPGDTSPRGDSGGDVPGRAGRCGNGSAALCPLPSPPGQQLWAQAGWRYRADCKFTWLCVALMSAILLFLIALLLGIVIHRECRAGGGRDGVGTQNRLSVGEGHAGHSPGCARCEERVTPRTGARGISVSVGWVPSVWGPLGAAHLWIRWEHRAGGGFLSPSLHRSHPSPLALSSPCSSLGTELTSPHPPGTPATALPARGTATTPAAPIRRDPPAPKTVATPTESWLPTARTAAPGKS